MKKKAMTGEFVVEANETWYKIEGYDHKPPFFMTLAGDSDVWAFISTSGSLTAGRVDQNRSFFPYETVDKIHLRASHTGPKTWIRIHTEKGVELWEPFAVHLGGVSGTRSVWKTLSGTKIRFRESHPKLPVQFEYEWSSSSSLGLVRTARLRVAEGILNAEVLDGFLNLIPPGITFEHLSTMSSLTDAYKWNESLAGGRAALYSLYAQIWDRAEPKESFNALVAWHAGLPDSTKTLLSANQISQFCEGEGVVAEDLTRGRRGSFLVQFPVDLKAGEVKTWYLVVDGPKSQVETFDFVEELKKGHHTGKTIEKALDENTAGVDELLKKADGFQTSADPMASAHHRANVLFNIMRGGVFVDSSRIERDDLLDFIRIRNKKLGEQCTTMMSPWPAYVERSFVIDSVRKSLGAQVERLVAEYMPLTFSRRHGDPSRPWNRFSIRVRDKVGKRIVNYQGNWRDIFQNWEALIPSEGEFASSMVSVFLGAMTSDGYNPYRVSRDGIDWEVIEHDNPWSNIGYWGDHQIIYVLRLMEALWAREPNWFEDHWNRPIFSFADIPYRLKPYVEQIANPKNTIVFDDEAHKKAHARAKSIGSDGLLVVDSDNQPVLANLGEKLAVILLAKASSLVPGGGLWLHTQRPEWNDANNALVGNGLSVVTLAHLRRFLSFLIDLPVAQSEFALSESTLAALLSFEAVVKSTDLKAVSDPALRRTFMDRVGAIVDAWRSSCYQGAAGRKMAKSSAGLLKALSQALLPLVDATLAACKRDDGLYHSYNIGHFGEIGKTHVGYLYPMLEGQVAMLSCGFLSLSEAVALLNALFKSSIYTEDRKTFLLYPDRQLPRFFERNVLDSAALALPIAQKILKLGRTDLLQVQSDKSVRFASHLANRHDLEAAAGNLLSEIEPLAEAYDRLLKHHEFTGRSGTMFGYEGLGCVYWHMVAKLLLAIQERVWEAYDTKAKEYKELKAFYFRVRDGLGYRKDPEAYGAFPMDPYSHTPGEGGAQQPGMTGQVKEEILTRWGELGLRIRGGKVRFDPVLLEESELPEGTSLEFTWAKVPYTYKQGANNKMRILTESGWQERPQFEFYPWEAKAVEVEIHFQRG